MLLSSLLRKWDHIFLIGTAGTCTLYGFGKEIAKLENMKSDAISYVQL